MKNIVSFLIALVLLALMLPLATSCGDGADGWVVQVWQPSTDGEPETLLAFGVVVDDGSHVLTVLDYEEDIPDELLVVSPEYGQFNASVQAVDYRTSATLLQLQDADLPVAEIGGSPSLGTEQQVSVCGWGGRNDEYMKTQANVTFLECIYPLFFAVSLPDRSLVQGKGWVGESGAVITNSNGRVIGLLGRYWSKLVIKLGMPGDLPLAVSINSAMELFTDSSYTSGPAIAIVLTRLSSASGVPGTSPRLPINAAEGFNSTVMELLDKLGEPLPLDDLPELNFHPEEGIMLVAAFTYPVELHGSDGSLLAETKWVGIQWDRDEGKPDRLLYGYSAYAVEGACSIEGDIGELVQLLQPVLQKLRR